MDWLRFLIGVLVGWLICWLIDYLICRRRRMAAEALLKTQLEQCNQDCAALRTQITEYQDVQVRLNAANAEIATLRAQAAEMKQLQVQLDGANRQIADLQAQLDGMKELQVGLGDANAELESLRAQVDGTRDLQASLNSANAEIRALKAQVGGTKDLQAELESVKAKVAGMKEGRTDLAGATMTTHALSTDLGKVGVPQAAVAAAAASGTPDDLTLIEGIGPKISALLNQSGVYTFAQLAGTAVERLNEILAEAGPHFHLADPLTWPQQAELARDAKWEAFQTLLDTLKGGRRV